MSSRASFKLLEGGLSGFNLGGTSLGKWQSTSDPSDTLVYGRTSDEPCLAKSDKSMFNNMIIPKSDSTQKFTDEVDELRAISGHMLGVSGVQIPKNNLDYLKLIREEDGTSETVDPQDCLGSLVLEVLYPTILTLLLEPTDLDAFGFLLYIP
ncbi:hypothetical protein Tco_1578779 [Tanacetum coccineum]